MNALHILKPKLKHISLFLLFGLMSLVVNAQPSGPGGGDCGETEGPDPCPLDNWIFALFATVLILTVIHLYINNKKITKLI